MYSSLPRSIVTSFVAGSLLIAAHSTSWAISPITLTVRTVPIPEKKDPAAKKPPVKVDVDQKKMEATLRNTSKEAVAGAVVNFYFIGKSAGAPEPKVLDKDSKTQDIAPGTPVVVESKVATATFTPAHRTQPAKGSTDKPESVKAAGDKFAGWAVQVMSGAEILAEAYSSPAMKAVVTATPAP
ncbi:MAG TPA: hypothetical protein VF585_09500 [Chthoniobacterales bacterium]|jgi:hypothetical protein